MCYQVVSKLCREITIYPIKILTILKKELGQKELPYPARISDPFKLLVSTLISTRTKDDVTHKASINLFKIADKPHKILKLELKEIERLIYPAGFYRTKAKNIKKLSEIIIKSFNGKVPNNFDDLTSLPGVGRKCANLVLSLGFNKDAICVDTHVHRISNRIGFVETKKPEETEEELKKIFPKKSWGTINTIFVLFGQKICKPISPLCSICPICKYCKSCNSR